MKIMNDSFFKESNNPNFSFQESKFKETGVLTPEEVCISIFIYIKSFNIFHQKY